MGIRIHAIQTGTVDVKACQRRASGAYPMRFLRTLTSPDWVTMPTLAWVIEHPEGAIVVDTGESSRAGEPGYWPRWHPYFRWGVRAHTEPEEEIGPQLERLNIPPDEVRWVVLTHLHTDHAGGLAAFPKSEILVTRKEHRAASGISGRISGYLPNRWPDWFTPRLVDFTSRAIGPFAETLALTKSGDVQLVATPGHTAGHMSVVVGVGEQTYFIAGDTSYMLETMLEGVVDSVSPSARRTLATLDNIREFVSVNDAVYLPSHDDESIARLAAAQDPAPPAKVAKATSRRPR